VLTLRGVLLREPGGAMGIYLAAQVRCERSVRFLGRGYHSFHRPVAHDEKSCAQEAHLEEDAKFTRGHQEYVG